MSEPTEVTPVPASIPSIADLLATSKEEVIPAAPIESPILEDEEIPTDIYNLENKKSPKQFAEERRANKGKKIEEAKKEVTQEYEVRLSEYEAKMAEREKTLQELQTKLARYEPELAEFKTLAQKREEEVDELRNGYYKQSLEVVSLEDDPDFVQANQSIMAAFDTHMPTFITGDDGEVITAAWDIAKDDPLKMKAIQDAIPFFSEALKNRNGPMMDRAVSYVGSYLGARAKLSAKGDQDILLPKESPEYKAIFNALKGATHPYQQMQQRMQALEQDRPLLVQRKLEAREGHVKSILDAKVFISQEQATQILQSDPENTLALVSALSHAMPELQEHLKASAAHSAKLLAAVPDGFIAPPPASKDPDAIRQHQQQMTQFRLNIADAVANAAVARVAGKVMHKLSEERDAAVQEAVALRKRLEQHSTNTNPGSLKTSGIEQDTDTIPTDFYNVT